MSIESEILRIQHNVADTYAAVAGKGGEVPLQPNSAKLAAAVESIPQDYGGVPIGTVISFMGTKAPKDYLICDGTSYPISRYPGLATFIAGQFGFPNHFGGDGETTFAVPDLRNLFLRGYHGGAEEQLSGDIGQRQEGTHHPFVWQSSGSISVVSGSYPLNLDSEIGKTKSYCYSNTANSTMNSASGVSYTARPVNMAVLYCIKAVPSKSADGEVYTTEEQRIGTWINGKPLYRKCIHLDSAYLVHSDGFNGLSVGKLPPEFVLRWGSITAFVGDMRIATYWLDLIISNGDVRISQRLGAGDTLCSNIDVILMYTKTTD